MAHTDREVRFLKDIAKEARHHHPECDRGKSDLQASGSSECEGGESAAAAG
jgi:hypothetical protein